MPPLPCVPKQYHVESSCSFYSLTKGSALREDCVREVQRSPSCLLSRWGCCSEAGGSQNHHLFGDFCCCRKIITLPNGLAPGSLPLRSQCKAKIPTLNHGTQELSLIWFSFLMVPVVTRDRIPIVSVYSEICKVLLLDHSSLNLQPTYPRQSTKAISSRASQCELSVRIYFQFLGQDPWENQALGQKESGPRVA